MTNPVEDYNTPYGRVTIIPARALRKQHASQSAGRAPKNRRRSQVLSSDASAGAVPVNLAYYMRPQHATYPFHAPRMPSAHRPPLPRDYRATPVRYQARREHVSHPIRYGRPEPERMPHYPPPPPRYAPTYTTYPPSTIHVSGRRAWEDAERNRLLWRLALKTAQLVSGLVFIALVVAPAKGVPFHDFAALAKAEGQLAVLIIAILVVLATAALLFFTTIAPYTQGWRNADQLFSVFGIIMYIILSGVEAWYAACYPPNGLKVRLYVESCYLLEWAIAAGMGALLDILYITDLVLSMYPGY